MKKVELSGIVRVGDDKQNNKVFSALSVSLRKLNLMESAFPSADFFTSDCMFHFFYHPLLSLVKIARKMLGIKIIAFYLEDF